MEQWYVKERGKKRVLVAMVGFSPTTFYQKSVLVQFSSVAQSCPTLCDPMDYSTPGFPVCHQHPELAQTQVHQVGDTIQPLSSPSPTALSLSQHQCLFQ